MMNKTEKKGCRIILNYLTDEEIFSLLDTITKRRIKRNTKEEAIDAIISFTDTAEQFLQRQKIKSEVLLRYVYLQPEKVYPSAASTKKTLIDTILKVWGKKDSEVLNVYPSATSSEKKKMKTVLKTCGKKDSEMLNVYPSATSSEKKKMKTVLKTCGKKDSEMLNFTPESEVLVMPPDIEIAITPSTNTTSKPGSDMTEHYTDMTEHYSQMSPIHSPASSSPYDDSNNHYSITPFARLKLKRKMNDSYFEQVFDKSNTDTVYSVGNYQSVIHKEGPSAFRKVGSASHSSQQQQQQHRNDVVTNNSKTTMNLIKLDQIKSAFTLSEDRDIPTSAFSIGQMFALKKRIKREAMTMELNHSESGSDGLSEPSLDESSPELKEDVLDSHCDKGTKVYPSATSTEKKKMKTVLKTCGKKDSEMLNSKSASAESLTFKDSESTSPPVRRRHSGEIEAVRPSLLGKEELQLQLALTISREEYEVVLIKQLQMENDEIEKEIEEMKMNINKKRKHQTDDDKRCQSWVSSSFDDFGNGFSTKPEPKRAKTFQPTLKSSLLSKRSLPVKRKLIENVEVSQTSQKPVSRRPNKTPETILWSDKHSPKLQVYPSATSTEKKKMNTVLKTCGKKDSEMLNVDTHVHASSGMNQKHLLCFIKKMMRTEPEVPVLKEKSGNVLTLKQMDEDDEEDNLPPQTFVNKKSKSGSISANTSTTKIADNIATHQSKTTIVANRAQPPSEPRNQPGVTYTNQEGQTGAENGSRLAPLPPQINIHVNINQLPYPPTGTRPGDGTNQAMSGDVQALGEKFAKWFYDNLNSFNPMVQLDLQDFGPQHFWDDIHLELEFYTPSIHTEMVDGSLLVSQRLLSFPKDENILFNPNITRKGVFVKSNLHGLVKILACGSVHRGNACLGVFHQAFGIIRDPRFDNNWKIKYTRLQMKTGEVNSLPKLEGDVDSQIEALVPL